LAPGFELTPIRFYDFRLDDAEITRHNASRLYAPVRLGDFRNVRPVVLLFGSYASLGRTELPLLESLYLEYRDRVQFIFVYIREALTEQQSGEAMALDGEAPRNPETPLERLRISNSFLNQAKLSMPCVIDSMDDATMRAYAANPARLYLVGREGRIVFVGSPGSLDPVELDAALLAN
jgi:hypothetical protein